MMTAIHTPKIPPKLLKARQRHSRWFAFALLPLIVFSMGVISEEGLVHELMEWLGFALVVVCVLGRSYCSAFIGGIKNEMVMRDGPFSIVRNPLYVFSFIGLVGIGLQSGMLVILAALIGAFMLYYPQVVAREEAFLADKFGEPYRRYMLEVPRWIPNLSLWREPASITVRPYFLRHTMMDAAMFFLPFPCFELLEMLHEQHIIPAYLTLF